MFSLKRVFRKQNEFTKLGVILSGKAVFCLIILVGVPMQVLRNKTQETGRDMTIASSFLTDAIERNISVAMDTSISQGRERCIFDLKRESASMFSNSVLVSCNPSNPELTQSNGRGMFCSFCLSFWQEIHKWQKKFKTKLVLDQSIMLACLSRPSIFLVDRGALHVREESNNVHDRIESILLKSSESDNLQGLLPRVWHQTVVSAEQCILKNKQADSCSHIPLVSLVSLKT